jgi:hypothetical protein
MRSQDLISGELRRLRARQVLGCSELCACGGVRVASAVADDLTTNRGPMPAQASSGRWSDSARSIPIRSSSRSGAVNASTGMLGDLNWSGLSVNSGHPRPHHALTGGDPPPHGVAVTP